MSEPGKKSEVITLGEWGDASKILLQVLSVVGSRPGKSLWVHGAVHGDELNCVRIATELYKRVQPERLSGTLTIIPVANPTAFQQFRRVSPVDDLDVNREYPGDAGGFLTQRTARFLFDRALETAAAILDLHTGGMYGYCPPYVIYQDGGSAAALARQLALDFGTEIVIQLPAGSNPGRLSAQAAARGIPCLTVELGGGAAVQPDMVERGVRGAMNTMVTLGMLEERVEAPAEQSIYTKRDWVRTNKGGMCELAVEPGSPVTRGQRIATIEDLSGNMVGELVAPFDGRVTLLRRFPAVRTGDWIALIVDESSKTLVRRQGR